MLDPVTQKMFTRCMCQKSVTNTGDTDQAITSEPSGQGSAGDVATVSPYSRLLDKITSLVNRVSGAVFANGQPAPMGTELETVIPLQDMECNLLENFPIANTPASQGVVVNGKMVAEEIASLVASINEVSLDIDKVIADMSAKQELPKGLMKELSAAKKGIVDALLHGIGDSVDETAASMGILLEKNGMLSVNRQLLETGIDTNLKETANALKNLSDTLYERIHLLINVASQMYAVKEKTEWGRGNSADKAQTLLEKSFRDRQEALENKLNTINALIESSYSLQGLFLQAVPVDIDNR